MEGAKTGCAFLRSFTGKKAAAVQAVLMSVYRALNLRSRDPLATIASALRTYMSTCELPPPPVEPACPAGRSVADG